MKLIEKFMSMPINLESMSIAYHDNEVEEYRYEETPQNSTIIASMGVDGVHYCVVPKQGATIDESPIYVVSPSDGEDTVVWVAKDFIDFLSIGVAMGSFLYVSYCHSCNKQEFLDILEESWSDEADEKKEAIKLLEEQFPIKKYDDLYKYIKKSYKDRSNHVKLNFESSDIKAIKLGHYNNE